MQVELLQRSKEHSTYRYLQVKQSHPLMQGICYIPSQPMAPRLQHCCLEEGPVYCWWLYLLLLLTPGLAHLQRLLYARPPVAAWDLTLLILALLNQELKIPKELLLRCHQVHVLYAAFC